MKFMMLIKGELKYILLKKSNYLKYEYFSESTEFYIS
jgi:hypothetical protein